MGEETLSTVRPQRVQEPLVSLTRGQRLCLDPTAKPMLLNDQTSIFGFYSEAQMAEKIKVWISPPAPTAPIPFSLAWHKPTEVPRGQVAFFCTSLDWSWVVLRTAKEWLLKISPVTPPPTPPTLLSTCHHFLYISPTHFPAQVLDLPCKKLPQHLNLSWTAKRADVVKLNTLNLCYRWAAANHCILFHCTFMHEVSNLPNLLLFFFLTRLYIFQCGCTVHFLQTSHTKMLPFTITLTWCYFSAWV